MTYRNDLDALTARQTALETEVRDRTKELDQARRLVEEIHARASLPVLDNIKIAAPCAARWDAMTGDARVRACGDCQKNVYNLSELTREEAESLIHEKEGQLCVRYFQRADGTILLKDCAVGVKRRRRRRIMAVGAAASLAGAAFAIQVRNRRANDFTMMGRISQSGGPSFDAPEPTADPAPRPPPRGRHTMGLVLLATDLHETKGELASPPPSHSPHDPLK